MTSKVFLTADTHFMHDNIIGLQKRPFAPREMTWALASRWNAAVSADDLVIHLGDLAFDKGKDANDKIEEIIASLNGRKILVRGNHDHKSNAWYLRNGFAFVCEEFAWENNGFKDAFTHRPLSPEEKQARGIRYNFHGHLHNNQSTAHPAEKGYVCLSVERTGYAPVNYEKLLQKLARGQPEPPKCRHNLLTETYVQKVTESRCMNCGFGLKEYARME